MSTVLLHRPCEKCPILSYSVDIIYSHIGNTKQGQGGDSVYVVFS